MNELIPVSGILFVAAITPGPNNILVLSEAIRGGWKTSVPVIAGIVSGALALFILVSLGLDLTLNRVPVLSAAFTIGASLYLVWLGWLLIGSAASGHREADPISPWGAAGFQLINPKSWVIMSVAASGARHAGLRETATVMILIFAACLSLWAFAGVKLASLTQDQTLERRINQAMGACLIFFASVMIANSLMAGNAP